MLVRKVTWKETDEALWAIDYDKAPGIDGFNSHFFMKAIQYIKHDIDTTLTQFFETGVLLPEINCTLVTLVPKVLNPSLANNFRPIACCTVLYKIIAKILTSRMQNMIWNMIDLAQSDFYVWEDYF